MMKWISIIILVVLTGFVSMDEAKVPNVEVETIDGKLAKTGDFNNNGKPYVICLWATWSKPSMLMLINIHDVYEEWREETGVKIITVSMDDARNKPKVAPIIESRGWEYESYIDSPLKFSKALNVERAPYIILCDGKGNIVWQHDHYVDGDEEVIHAELMKLLSK